MILKFFLLSLMFSVLCRCAPKRTTEINQVSTVNSLKQVNAQRVPFTPVEILPDSLVPEKLILKLDERKVE